MENTTTQQFNFVLYNYLLDEGKPIDLLENQDKLDKDWERKLREARMRQKSKEEIIKQTQEKILKEIK